MRYIRSDKSAGFTLIEVVMVIVLLGIIAAVAIPRFGSVTDNAKVTATKEEMRRLKIAIIGDPQVTAAGKYVNKGYFGDVGALPGALTDLTSKPGAVAVYNNFTGLGWNGPYLDSANGDYLTDAWSVGYSYDAGARTITSSVGSTNIVISF